MCIEESYVIADCTDVSEHRDAQSDSLGLRNSSSEDIGRGSSGMGPQAFTSKDMQMATLGHPTACSSQTWLVRFIEVMYPSMPAGTTNGGQS